MATETERKFLVKNDDFHKVAVKKIEITQAYLVVERDKTIRLRISDDKAYLTIKSGRRTDTISRSEWEYEISADDARKMMQICIPGKIVKTRYIVPSGKHKIEVDVFHDKNEGLIIAEIELESDDEQYLKPDWLGNEVTGDSRYYNAYLIK